MRDLPQEIDRDLGRHNGPGSGLRDGNGPQGCGDLGISVPCVHGQCADKTQQSSDCPSLLHRQLRRWGKCDQAKAKHSQVANAGNHRLVCGKRKRQAKQRNVTRLDERQTKTPNAPRC